MKGKKYTANQLAQWFINRSAMDVDMYSGEYLTNMKLQKLLYFAQCLSYTINDKPLFSDDIEAWEHGPVVSKVYKKYNVLRAGSIEDVKPVEIDEDTAALLEYVYSLYGIYSASQLRNLSHKQESYKKNYVAGKKHSKIPNEDIRKDFKDKKEKLTNEFKKNYKEYLNFAETCYINSVPELKVKLKSDDELVEVDWRNEL